MNTKPEVSFERIAAVFAALAESPSTLEALSSVIQSKGIPISQMSLAEAYRFLMELLPRLVDTELDFFGKATIDNSALESFHVLCLLEDAGDPFQEMAAPVQSVPAIPVSEPFWLKQQAA